MLKINSKAAHPVSKVIFQRLALIVRFVLLGLFVLLILGCQTAESPAEISQEPTATSQTILTNPPEDSITPKPTATSEPLPTATLEATATNTPNKIEIALSATPPPAPTPCPLPDVAAAFDYYATQEGYQMQVTLRFGDSSAQPTYVIDLWHLPHLDQYEIFTTQHVGTTAGDQEVIVHDYVVGNTVYRNTDEGVWEAFGGPAAHDEVMGLWIVNAFAALLNSPLPPPDAGPGCGLNGRYEFSNIDITSSEIYTAVHQSMIETIDNVNFGLGIHSESGALRYASLDFNPYTNTWLQLDLMFIEQDEPPTFELPENLPEPSFMYELPLPQESALVLEGSDFLVHATNLSLDDATDFYVTALNDFGWTIQNTNIEDEKVEFFLEKDDAVLVLFIQNRLPGLFPRASEGNYIFFIIP
ncbi:MAG: hypothetical protein KC433_24175 [Anaerolineales bacterium]|nr:hypothetical protein [Anaerolineales bacterium]MCB8937205.1 hypothetical protein [Ardenticatenaceae bacterium]